MSIKALWEISNENYSNTANDAFLQTALERTRSVYPDIAINENHFKKLLHFVLHTSGIEEKNNENDQQELINRAIKLMLVFGNSETVIEYLEQFEADHHDSPKILHDACLFSLPGVTEKWNVDLWREIIKNHHPTNPSDLILRLLPFAGKIEQYVKNEHVNLVQKLQMNITEEFEHRFALEFDALRQSDGPAVSADNKQQELSLNKEVNKRFNHYLMRILKFPAGEKPGPDQIAQLKNRKDNPTLEDERELNNIKTQIVKEKAEEKLKQESIKLGVMNQSKQSYVSEKLNHANKTIESIVRERSKEILSPKTQVQTLMKYANQCMYTRANENLRAAAVFFKEKISEEIFNEYLSLKPCDDKEKIPDIMIDGKDIAAEFDGYYIKKLDPSDPRAAVLGKLTSCCQSLDGEGKYCAVHGIVDANGGFYVLCKKNSEVPSDDDNIVSQCWAWRGQDDVLVFDSIETQINFNKKNQYMVQSSFRLLADKIIQTTTIPEVRVGFRGGDEGLAYRAPEGKQSEPVGYRSYRESEMQLVMANRKFPMLAIANTPATVKFSDNTINKELVLTTKMLDLYKEFYKGQVSTFSPNDDLVFLAAKKHEWDVVLWLVRDKNTNPNLSHGYLSLINYAQFDKRDDVVSALISMGADPNKLLKDNDVDRSTRMLHEAARQGLTELVQLLIDEKGADVNKKNTGAHYDSLFDIPILLKAAASGNLKLVQFLIEEKQVDIHLEGKNSTLLGCAVRSGNLEMVKWLVLEKKIDPHHTDEMEGPMLSLGIDAGNFELVKWLVEEQQVNIDEQDLFKRSTPLHHAIENNRWDIIKYLIENGANLKLSTRYDDTLFDILTQLAKQMNKPDILILLDKTRDNEVEHDQKELYKDSSAVESFDVNNDDETEIGQELRTQNPPLERSSSSSEFQLRFRAIENEIEQGSVRELANKFDRWMNDNIESHEGDGEHKDNQALLDWLSEDNGLAYIDDYDEFCELAIEVHQKGYATDPPPLQSEFEECMEQCAEKKRTQPW